MADDWSAIQLAAAWGLWGLAIGASQQGHKPTTPGSRRIFAALFALTCVVALVVGGELAPALMAVVGGWTIGLGFADSFDPNDSAPVERSFSGQVIRRG